MTTIALTELTQATLEGNGVFDTLMRANKAHLESEFAKGRLKGPEYATVYLGSLQAVMQTALAFLAQRQKIDLEAQLLTQQIAQTIAQTALTNAQLLQTQAQKLQVEAQTALITQQRLNAVDDLQTNVKQRNKIDSEIILLDMKAVTERAQTQTNISAIDSVLGKQIGLYQAQADGFKRDAEQKVAKMLIDTWNVRRTTDEATVVDATNKLSDIYVGQAVTKMFTGIGI